MAHDVTITGTNSFASLDGSSSDHDGAVNGVFTVNDGNLAVNGVVNCNDDTGSGDSACSMVFAVSGNLSINNGGALYAENRSGSGTGGAITLTVGGNLALNGNAIVSTASRSSSGANGGAITANVTGSIAVGAGSTIDSGSANARGGAIVLASAAGVTVDGNVLSGPSRTFLSTRLSGGAALDGGTSNTIGGTITISSSTFAEPAVAIGATANIVSQGGDSGAGPITIDGCGIGVRGLIAALSRKDSAAVVSIRSGKDVLIDGRDLGGSGTRMGRIRADAPSGSALNKRVDILATETIDIYGPASGLYVITSVPGLHDSKSWGGLIRIISTGDAVNGSGNLIDDGHTATGDSGGTVEISAKEDVNLDTAVIRAVGDFSSGNPNRGGGAIRVRSYSGDVIWTNGTGEVRPVGSTSNLPLADQGSIVLTACGTVNTTGSSFPVMGSATSVFPETHTGVCSPAAPSLPSGVPPLITCNTPPVANDASASTNEDTTVTITLTGSDADGDPLTFTIVSGPANGSLGAVISTGPTSATVDYTPNLNYNGGDSFVFRAHDGNGGTDDATATITITAVNDAPSFQAGPSVTVLEDSGAYFAAWATAISAGPADESGQTLTFNVTNNNNSLFSVQPAVDASGNLSFTTAANASGSATVTVTLSDNGGTANGGDDTSDPQPFTITITAVNDEPSFTGGGDVTVNEDSGAYLAAWASAISAGPGESGQTLTFVVTNDDNSLFSAQPAISSTGVLTFTPAANANGSATVTVVLTDDGGTANGGDDTSAPQTFTITVNAVNDAPSFTGGGDVTVNEDSAAYSAAWATDISAGPANESTQTVSFSVSNNNNALFAAQPAIDPSGNLTFTLAANASGFATVTVTLSDNGGTANGGDDTSAPQTFTITVNAVNDPPTFTAGGNVEVNEDSGAYTATWATAISPGPNESGQTVTFSTSNDNNALFSVQPSINSLGVLTFTPAPNAFGTATVTVTAQDNGGTANGGDDTSDPATFTIKINGINDPPTAGADAWETEGNTELRVDHGTALTPHVFDTTPSGTGVLHNDADTVEGDPFVITGVVGCADTTAPFVCAVTGGTLTLEANGSFTFQPSAGATSASFQYTVTDQPTEGTPASATGTVTLTIHDMIWYVNGAAPAGGDGTSASPFNNFSSLIGGADVDAPGAYIFVHTSAVAGSIELEASQRLWGEGVGLIIPRNLNGNGFPTTLVAPGVRPTVTSFGDAVLVNSVTGVEIAGLNITASSGNPIEVNSLSGGGAASASIYSNVLMAASAEGIDINADSAAGTSVAINTTNVTAMGNGVDLMATAGTVVFSYSNGTVASATGHGIVADGTAADALIVNGLANVTVSSNTAGNGIFITSARFDANASTGAIETVNAGTTTVGAAGLPVGGAAVLLANASGDLAFGSLTAHGATTGVTIAGTGLFTGATGMRVTSGGGAITAGAGTGLSVTNATIGAANLAFTSISATGAAVGINLNNTGTTGGLVVSGTGAAGSGGSIPSATQDAVRLVSTRASLADMSLTNSGQSHIDATNVDGLTLTRINADNSVDHGILGSTVRNLVIQGGLYDRGGAGSGVANKHGVFITNLLGTSSVSGATFRRSNTIQFRIANTAATNAYPGAPDTLTVSNTTWDTHTSPFAGDHLSVDSGTGGNFRLVTNATGGINSFTTAGTAVQATTSGSGRIDVSLTGVKSDGNTAGIVVGATATASGTYAIFGNKTANGTGISNSGALGISIVNTGTGSLSGTIDDNTITNAPVGNGLQVIHQGSGSGASAITNNVISGNVGTNGIRAQALTGSGTLSLNIHGNNVSSTSLASLEGISIESGGSGAGHTNTICLNMSNNVSSTSSGQEGYRLRQRLGTTFNLQNFAGSGTSTADITTWVNTTKSNSGTVEVLIGSTFNAAPGSCPTP